MNRDVSAAASSRRANLQATDVIAAVAEKRLTLP
jgi:hypothetical protein